MRTVVIGLAVLFAISVAPTAWAADLSGEWTGTWTSCSSGHGGPLSATFCKRGDSCYRVEFTGRFLKIIPFKYTVTLSATETDDGRTLLTGSQKLPIFGVFHYTATADACTFAATYTSEKDNGRFDLKRK